MPSPIDVLISGEPDSLTHQQIICYLYSMELVSLIQGEQFNPKKLLSLIQIERSRRLPLFDKERLFATQMNSLLREVLPLSTLITIGRIVTAQEYVPNIHSILESEMQREKKRRFRHYLRLPTELHGELLLSLFLPIKGLSST